METTPMGEELALKLDSDQIGFVTHHVNSGTDEISSLTGNASTLDWLNNQVAVAISNGVLPITCKNLRGELHLDKFGSGNRGKCIEAYGQTFTPTEFEAFAGRAQCKDWKRSIRFHGRPLLQLIELDILKVHAVSCTCASCWNGDSAGPVRLHDVKRKYSSFHNLVSSSSGTKRNSYSSQQSVGFQVGSGSPQHSAAAAAAVTPGGGGGGIDEPLVKQIRLEVQSQRGQQDAPPILKNQNQIGMVPNKPKSLTLVRPDVVENVGKALSNATIVRSPGGTLRIANLNPTEIRPQQQQQAPTATATPTTTRQLQLSTSSGQVTLLLPQSAGPVSPNKTQPASISVAGNARKQTMYIPVSASGAAVNSANQQGGIPLGLAYAPVQLPTAAVPRQQQHLAENLGNTSGGGGVTIISAELNDHWTNMEEYANSLQQQVNSLHSMIYQSRQKADKALQDLWQQTQVEKDKEIQKFKIALRQHQVQNNNLVQVEHQQDMRRPNQKLCVNCNRTATMTCAVCQSTFYCSEFCVRRDAPMHREKCNQPKDITVEMINID